MYIRRLTAKVEFQNVVYLPSLVQSKGVKKEERKKEKKNLTTDGKVNRTKTIDDLCNM